MLNRLTALLSHIRVDQTYSAVFHFLILAYSKSCCFLPYSLLLLCCCQVNEAFAPQYLAVEKELGLDPNKTNLCGGAIALGHPLATSGNRITGHLTHQLR